MDDILKVSEVAQRLRLTEDAVYQMVASGKLPFFRVGQKAGAIRFRWNEIEKWIEGQNDKKI